jgi:hypothetical protein
MAPFQIGCDLFPTPPRDTGKELSVLLPDALIALLSFIKSGLTKLQTGESLRDSGGHDFSSLNLCLGWIIGHHSAHRGIVGRQSPPRPRWVAEFDFLSITAIGFVLRAVACERE